LLASRLAFGAGYAMVWTAGLCWLADAAGGPTALGGSVASAGVGGVAGPAASGALTQHFGLAGRRAVSLPVLCGGILAVIAALSLGVLSTASLVLIVMLCAATAARSVLWTVSYPLAAGAAERGGTGLGAAVGLLNGVWAATAVLGPPAAGLAAEHLSARAAFGLTEAACAAALAVAVAAAWPTLRPSRRMARTAADRDLADDGVLLQSGSRQQSNPS
jgi:MFS family permease